MKTIYTVGKREREETTVAELVAALLLLDQDKAIVSSYEGIHGTVDATIYEDKVTYTELVYELSVEHY